MAKSRPMRSGSIRHDGLEISFRITRRPRITRRIHLELDEDGGLCVVAPPQLGPRSVEEALQQRAPYVARFLRQARKRRQEAPDPVYAEGEQQLFLGREYTLEILPDSRNRAKTELVEDAIRVRSPDTSPESVRNRLMVWYRAHAGRLFEERMTAISRQASWVDGAPDMRLRWMKRTWGSCSSKGVITINPQLIKTPQECIDYVIAHEICHLKEHNHGAGFYALQQSLCPDWRDCRQHLRDNAHRYLRL